MTEPTPGQLLRRLRAEKGWTQADVSYVLHRPAQAVSEIECGKKAVVAATALPVGGGIRGACSGVVEVAERRRRGASGPAREFEVTDPFLSDPPTLF
jgi:DNA-binding XRE family transcriptional regulator